MLHIPPEQIQRLSSQTLARPSFLWAINDTSVLYLKFAINNKISQQHFFFSLRSAAGTLLLLRTILLSALVLAEVFDRGLFFTIPRFTVSSES